MSSFRRNQLTVMAGLDPAIFFVPTARSEKDSRVEPANDASKKPSWPGLTRPSSSFGRRDLKRIRGVEPAND
jgi:hypothetical protein